MTNLDRSIVRNILHWGGPVIFLIMFSLALTSARRDSPTFDEQGFLIRGLAYLRSDEQGRNRNLRVGHPLGLNALNAALLVYDPTVKLPVNDPSWEGTSFHRPAELFLWEIGNDVDHIMFLARLPTIWLGLLLTAIAARWATEMSWNKQEGSRARRQPARIAGLITLTLVAFDPNILAHMRLVTTDLGLTAAAALAGYLLWRYLKSPTIQGAIIAGGAFGLLLNTKFTAFLFLPLFGLLALIALLLKSPSIDNGDTRTHRQELAIGFVIIPIAAFFVLWAGHGFQAGGLSIHSALSVLFNDMTVPLSDYFDQLMDIGNRLDVATPSFLLGRYSDTGWWYYFPVAFLVKTPLSILLLLVGSISYMAWWVIANRQRQIGLMFDLGMLLIPALGFFTIALTADINLGYRHIMPVLPFFYVLIGVTAGRVLAGREFGRLAKIAGITIAVSITWLIVVSAWIYPHYLTFFNLIAGGPDGGWRILVDSNLDWGQDLGPLATWLEENDVDRVWLSYFGEARPEYYGIRYDGLDSFPPRLMNPEARPFYPPDPAPGWYAISATTLQGVHFDDHDQFFFFRERGPVARVGFSIFLYKLESRGEPVDLLLAGKQVDEILPEDYTAMGTNDVTIRWFDPAQAVLLPGSGRPAWLAIGTSALNPLLVSYLETDVNPDVSQGEVDLRFATISLPERNELSVEMQLDDAVTSFLGADLIRRESSLVIRSFWRQETPSRPVKIFIHLLNDEDEIIAQWDGLGVAWEGWREGDTLVQLHPLLVDDLPPGTYRLVAGLYDPASFQRWATNSADNVIELGQVTLP